jgi:hypothetical protein
MLVLISLFYEESESLNLSNYPKTKKKKNVAIPNPCLNKLGVS